MKLYSATLLIFLCLTNFLKSQDLKQPIRIDQEGYYLHAPKKAIIAGNWNKDLPDHPIRFFLLRENSSDTVFQGILATSKQSLNSSLQTRVADFGAFTEPGYYKLSVAGYGNSYPFRIAERVHQQAAVASLKAFYFQRASMALDSLYAGKWKRSAGHPDDSVIIHPSAASENRKAGSIISTPGGWYDAGDYNKYVVNSGISMGTLLSAYEDFHEYFDTLRLNIPSLPTPIPDILTELLYNLRWMLSMQDPTDGGVYTKCTNPAFDPMVMPEAAHGLRYVVEKSTAATLDFSAVCAQAARIFSKYKKALPGLSDSCLLASKKAWKWALQHPALVYDQNRMNQQFEPKIITGGYGDQNFTDEFFWAACELFITTGSTTYKEHLSSLVNNFFGLPSWSQTGLLGYYSLIRTRAISTPVTDTIRNRLIRMANEYIRNAEENAFLTVMGGRKSDFNWGSNSNAANQGILLIQAYLLTKESKYFDAALGNLEYICGRNATGYCFITGIGTRSPIHPHHRPSIADGVSDPVPGLLVGGPNPGEQDHCHYDFHEAETAYSDSDCSYASNEIAINWNAPLVYLANAIEFLEPDFTAKINK